MGNVTMRLDPLPCCGGYLGHTPDCPERAADRAEQPEPDGQGEREVEGESGLAQAREALLAIITDLDLLSNLPGGSDELQILVDQALAAIDGQAP